MLKIPNYERGYSRRIYISESNFQWLINKMMPEVVDEFPGIKVTGNMAFTKLRRLWEES